MLTEIIDHINTLKYLPARKDSTKPSDPTNVVPANRRAPPLDGGQSNKIGGIWTLKNEIISPIFYEIIIKKKLKGDISLYLKNFCNHIKMCLNAVTILR